MKNKKILYGLLAVGAIASYYFWNKSRKKSTCSTCSTIENETYTNIDAGGSYGLGCKVCQRPDGSTYFAQQGSCVNGHFCLTSIRPKSEKNL